MARQQRSVKQSADQGLSAMLLAVACCAGLLILVLLIPVIGWGPGLVVLGIGALAMFTVHWRFMRHGGHR
jgi:Flp pilus assembly protein TadB